MKTPSNCTQEYHLNCEPSSGARRHFNPVTNDADHWRCSSNHPRFKSVMGLTVWLILAGFALAEEKPVDYLREVKPVLQARCFACHGALSQEAGLRLDTAGLIRKGADSGAIVVPGEPDKSSLLNRITAQDAAERMPPDGEPLKSQEIDTIKRWIAAGVVGPVDEAPERDPRDHWAFKAPTRPKVSAVAEFNWTRNPIDSYLAARREEQGLKPQPAADKRTWLRRVYLDLIGLPPSQEELEQFVADQSDDAVERVVDQLLDSPHHGERWGRHWMDIWRYSDWWGLGEESRNSQRHIWHWRDWIVESINADKGYDQMLREMLAADELYPEDTDRLRAGGFLGRQYFKFNRTSWLDETIEHTSKAMLGLTFNCAKCHDHKYDPFSQADYYRYRAIFEPYQVRLDATDGHIDYTKDGIPRPFDCNLDVKTQLHIRGDDRNPDPNRVIEPAVPAFLSSDPLKIEPVTLPAVAIEPGLRPFVVEAHLKLAAKQIATKQTELDAATRKLEEVERQLTLAPEEKQRNEGKIILQTNFQASLSDLWEMREGTWTFSDGKLTQSNQETIRSELRLKQQIPADFEAKLKFTPTGGKTWKSVGLTFDGTDTNELLAYASANAPGPKVQFAYKKGDYLFPTEAMKAAAIELNKSYELTIRMRGPLINMSLNGELVVAYRLSIARQKGVMQIITYDATADFSSFELKELAANAYLTEAITGANSNGAVLPVDQAKLAIEVVRKSLALAQAEPDSIRARSAADQVRYQTPRPANAIELIQAAAKIERTVAALKAEEDIAKAELDLARAATDKKAEFETKLTTARTALENAQKLINEPTETYTPIRGSSKVHESNLETEESRLKPFPATSTGRRTALARWMTDRRNPLPARVAVNHIWSRHFGKPLVSTVFDFGRKGTPPTHPELLDWLAVELVASGNVTSDQAAWDMKRIHRLIVTSNAYRMSSSSANAANENLSRDADNRYYWRMNPIRMESQNVRDSLLRIAGQLDDAMSGPTIPVSNELSRRRSIYFFHSNIQREKFLSMFDDASVLDCYRRAESIVPQQALALENSPLATEMAKKIVDRISVDPESKSEPEFIRTAFAMILASEPTTAELAAVSEAMTKLKEAARRANRQDPDWHAQVNLVQALLNHNDFVTVR